MLQQNLRYYLNKFQAQPCNLFAKVLPEMQETLGELIRRRMKDLGIRNNSELARMIKKSDAYVGDLINDTGKTKSGTYKPRAETVANLSTALQIQDMDILAAMGMTSQLPSVSKKPRNVADFFAILDELGLDIQLDGGYKTLENLDEDDLQELLDSVVANAVAKSKRKSKINGEQK